MEKHLVIGSAGQLGIELVLGLQSRYGVDSVVASDIRMDGDIESNRSRFIKLDATDKVAVRKVLSEGGYTCVYHLVAMLSAKGEDNPIAAWDLNMKSILNVLECSKEGLVEKVFWPSSIAVFGPEAPKNRTPHDSVCNPTTIYGVSKVAGELWCKYYHEHYGVDVRSLRYPGLIGHRSLPGGGTTDYAVEAFYCAVEGRPFECYLEPGEALPMMHMDDAIRATIDLMEAPSENIKLRTSYNLSGCSFSPDELNREIAALVPGFDTKYSPDKRQYIAASWPNSIDDSLAREHWGWKPEYNTEKLVSTMIEALKNSLSLER
jgi:threonine 3-dehydrogenase|tara:strand:+ start:156 stop:1112 length:957 start_codon:yes stop_codon:yes gene_type:complete